MEDNNSKGLVGKLTDVKKGDLILLLQHSLHDKTKIEGETCGYVVELNRSEIKLSMENPFAKVNDYNTVDGHIIVRTNMFRATSSYHLHGFNDYKIIKKSSFKQKEEI